MQPEKLSLLFGKAELPDVVELDGEGGLLEYVRQTSIIPLDDLEVALRAVLARQILDDEPPLVWETARRLLGLGFDRSDVLDQLSRALSPIIEAAVQGDTDGYEERYEDLLRALPLRTEDDIRRAIRFVMTVDMMLMLDDLKLRVLAELYDADVEEPVEEPVDDVIDQMIEDGELEVVAGDIVVDPAQLCAEVVLTTRVSDARTWPPVRTDFAGLAAVTDEFDDLPADAAAGQLVMARIRGRRAVVTPVETPPLDEAFVAEIRRAYDSETADLGLPITFRELTMGLLVEDMLALEKPRLPLTELAAAAGLEIRGDLIGDGDATWRRLAHSRAAFRIVDLLDDDKERREDALEVYGFFERIDMGDGHDVVTAADLRHGLDLLADDDVLAIVTDQLFGYDEDPKSLDAAEVFARRLTLAASRPMHRAVAAVVTAHVEERRCNPLAAADALAEAVREAPDFFTAVDRLAWTRADQGRAGEAKALWLRLGLVDHPDVEAIDSATTGQQERAANLRRNDPCWCGSGRKYKACHLRATDLPPLTARFKWLLRKTIAYVERRGAPLDNMIFNVAWQLSGDDPDRFREALASPIVLDVIAFEFGWLEKYLAERGVLLPEDEQQLLASWLPIRRALYEVAAVRPGEGLTVRDVRTGELAEVTEHTFSRQTFAGELICSRAVPDGQSRQLVGALVQIPPEDKEVLLDILDASDSAAVADGLLAYVAALPELPRP